MNYLPRLISQAAGDLRWLLATGQVITRHSVAGVDFNATGDVATFTGLPAKYVIESIVFHTWSATPSALLVASLRDAAAAGGNSLVGSVAGLNGMVTATGISAIATPLSAVLGASRVLSAASLYLNVSVANGTALTGSAEIFVRRLT